MATKDEDVPVYKKFKLFCLSCDWFLYASSDFHLWDRYAFCPKCFGCTDAVETKFHHPPYIPPTKPKKRKK